MGSSLRERSTLSVVTLSTAVVYATVTLSLGFDIKMSLLSALPAPKRTAPTVSRWERDDEDVKEMDQRTLVVQVGMCFK